MEEGAEHSLEFAEVILVDQWLHPDNRRIFIVEGVAPGDEDLMAERRPWHQFFKRETGRHMREGIDGLVRHVCTGVSEEIGVIVDLGDIEDSRM